MSCQICGRSHCMPSFHSDKEQEKLEYRQLKEKVIELTEKCKELERIVNFNMKLITC